MKLYLHGDFENPQVQKLEKGLQNVGYSPQRTQKSKEVQGIMIVCFTARFSSADFALEVFFRQVYTPHTVYLLPVVFQGGRVPNLMAHIVPIRLCEPTDFEMKYVANVLDRILKKTGWTLE